MSSDYNTMIRASKVYVAMSNSFRHTNTLYLENVLGDAYIALTTAQNNYDEKKCTGNREYYIFISVKQSLMRIYRDKRLIKRAEFEDKLVSLEYSISEDLQLKDVISAGKTTQQEIDDHEEYIYILDYLKNNLKPRTFEMFELYLNGWTVQNIGNKYSISKQRVSQIFKKQVYSLSEHIKKELNAI